MTLHLGTALSRNEDIVDARIGPGELALLCRETSRYYGLEGPGSRVWELLATPMSVADVCEGLMKEFEVAPDICERDTLELLAHMLVEGLVREVPAGA